MSELSTDPTIEAKELGKVVVVPSEYELFIDVDNGEAGLNVLEMGLETMAKAGLPVAVTQRIPSKTPGHYHVYATVPFPLTPEVRIALQAGLGSDLRRELLSLARVLLHVPRDPTVFFEDPEE